VLLDAFLDANETVVVLTYVHQPGESLTVISSSTPEIGSCSFMSTLFFPVPRDYKILFIACMSSSVVCP